MMERDPELRLADPNEVIERLEPPPEPVAVARPRRWRYAAAALVGEHEFAAFCKRREGATTIRRVLELRWDRSADGVAELTVRADAFCHHMVRSLTGCLLAVGEGRQQQEWPGAVLSAAVRDPRVAVVPARGLTLEEVAYPPDDELVARAEATRVVRTRG